MTCISGKFVLQYEEQMFGERRACFVYEYRGDGNAGLKQQK